MGFRQSSWVEPCIFELGYRGRKGHTLPTAEKSITTEFGELKAPRKIQRKSPLALPELSEVEVVRHFTRLSQMNYSVDLGLYPLGSCTMKYNPKINDKLANAPSLTRLHPYQNGETVQGILEILHTLGKWLAEITGMFEVSLQPAAGAQGEFLGALIMRAHHKFNGKHNDKKELLIPDSAHGTNPASGTMAGFKVLIVPSGSNGSINIEALKTVTSKRTAGLMLTNPNTLGFFEENIREITELIHEVDGLVYYDGANLNPILGKTRPGDMGFDVVHINIHKTFSTPHGGGGPGAGPIGVSERLEKFLPVPRIVYDGKQYVLSDQKPHSIGKIRSFYGNVAVLVRAYCYLLSLGAEGLIAAAEVSTLNANYLLKKLSELKWFDVPFGSERLRKHECVLSVKSLFREKGIRALDVSKRLLDEGIHAPTVYFPTIIEEALMIEPTESFEKEELDRFVDAMRRIAEEAESNPDKIRRAPHNTSIGRIDEAKASHPLTLVPSWRVFKSRS
ncbi:MAG: aminomethyl-transferring glycine dehydrogenase subunit GcvPB [Candidatus Bathyarchaeota archaeon]|nr:MAG: aminomethyl-transferring glycine dehydrogenase subunit GcvPB [Candidatus Bathyarchaeota archaeon]